MKKVLVLLLIVSSFFFSSCNFDKAQSFGNEFCYTLSENVEEAKGFLHPDSKLNGEKFDKFIAQLEKFNEIDFSQDIEIISTSFTSSSYGVVWESYKYEYTYEIRVANKIINMFVVVIDDSNGYGVYSFGIIE